MIEYSWLSILPPLISLSMALYTRRVLFSLICGVFAGALILSGWNPFHGLLFVIEKELFVQISKPFNSQIIFIMILINGFVALIDGSGGIFAFGRLISRSIRGPIQTQLFAWCGGLAIFFTDSGNSLILGPIFRPLFRKAKICREKLAYILDATSSADCVMIPFIGWGVYSIGLIQAAYDSMGLKQDGFLIFVKVIPFQFYPILALLTVPIMILLKKDFSLMSKFQNYYEESEVEIYEKESLQEQRARVHVVIIPMLVLFISMFSGFLYFYLSLGTLPGSKIRVTLIFAYIISALVCSYLIKKEKNGQKIVPLYLLGASRILPVLAIIIMAWSLGDICTQLGTGQYLSSLIHEGFPSYLFPAIVFVLGAIISFATGSSWGTFGILMPIALPVAFDIHAALLVTIGAVLSGGLFGDHCSPISDTTILASMGAECNHANHVNSQIPYALTAALCAVIAFAIAGYTQSYWSLAAALPLLLLFAYMAPAAGKNLKFSK